MMRRTGEGDPRTYLKPCRICGNTEIVYERYRHQAGERWRCRCTKCLACIDPGWAQNLLAVRKIWNLSPPNEPLTLEQLREMDGEPVYLYFVDGGEWVLIRVYDEKIFITHRNAICSPVNLVFKCGGKLYRRKPEEV